VNDRRIASGAVGLEETVKFVFSDNLRKAASTATFTGCHSSDGRMPHDQKPNEIELIAPGIQGHAHRL